MRIRAIHEHDAWYYRRDELIGKEFTDVSLRPNDKEPGWFWGEIETKDQKTYMMYGIKKEVDMTTKQELMDKVDQIQTDAESAASEAGLAESYADSAQSQISDVDDDLAALRTMIENMPDETILREEIRKVRLDLIGLAARIEGLLT